MSSAFSEPPDCAVKRRQRQAKVPPVPQPTRRARDEALSAPLRELASSEAPPALPSETDRLAPWAAARSTHHAVVSLDRGGAECSPTSQVQTAGGSLAGNEDSLISSTVDPRRFPALPRGGSSAVDPLRAVAFIEAPPLASVAEQIPTRPP
jgi:hypothetical protein